MSSSKNSLRGRKVLRFYVSKNEFFFGFVYNLVNLSIYIGNYN